MGYESGIRASDSKFFSVNGLTLASEGGFPQGSPPFLLGAAWSVEARPYFFSKSCKSPKFPLHPNAYIFPLWPLDKRFDRASLTDKLFIPNYPAQAAKPEQGGGVAAGCGWMQLSSSGFPFLSRRGGERPIDDGMTANPLTLRYLLVGGFSNESHLCTWHVSRDCGAGHRMDGGSGPHLSAKDVRPEGVL